MYVDLVEAFPTLKFGLRVNKPLHTFPRVTLLDLHCFTSLAGPF